MPVLDGAKASTALRTMGVMIPIIGVTGNALMEDREQFIQAGANAVLCKPVTKPQLQATLQEYLRVATG